MIILIYDFINNLIDILISFCLQNDQIQDTSDQKVNI